MFATPMYRGGAGQPYGPHHLGLRCAVSWWKHETGQNFRSADGPGQMHDMSDECLRRPHQAERGCRVRSAACKATIARLRFHFAATKVRPKMQRCPLGGGAPVQCCQWLCARDILRLRSRSFFRRSLRRNRRFDFEPTSFDFRSKSFF